MLRFLILLVCFHVGCENTFDLIIKKVETNPDKNFIALNNTPYNEKIKYCFLHYLDNELKIIFGTGAFAEFTLLFSDQDKSYLEECSSSFCFWQ